MESNEDFAWIDELEQRPLTPEERERALASLRSEQNFARGMLAASGAMLVCAFAWAAISIQTGYQITWMATILGMVVGISNRRVGKGMEQRFGIGGAAISILGCTLGDLAAVYHALMSELDASFIEVTRIAPLSAVVISLFESMALLDYLFLGLAFYAGYVASFRRISEYDLAEKVRKPACAAG